MESDTNDASMSRAGLWAASIVGVALIGFAVWQYLPAGEESEQSEANGSPAQSASFQPPPAGSVSVTAGRAIRGQLIMRITANGIAEAQRLLRVTSEVQGTIDHVAVEEGAWVEAGTPLVSVNDFELLLTRDQREEALLNAVMNFADDQLEIPGADGLGRDRTDTAESATDFLRRMISDAGYATLRAQPQLEERLAQLTRADLYAALAQLTAQRVALEQAELNVARTKIAAPFGGQVAGIDATGGPNSKSWPVVGQKVNAGTELMMLVDPDPIHLRVEVIESEISFVREGRRAEVTFQALPGETFTGTIEAIDAVVDSQRKTLSVLVTLPNPDHRLKPGMFAHVVLETEIFEDRLLVPSNAVLVRDTDRPLVFVVKNGRAQWAYITRGLQNDDWVEVLDGVVEGDQVVTSGHFTLAHDTPVNIIDPEGSESGGQ